MSSDWIVGLELIRENAVKKWRDVMGPTDPNKARIEAPTSLRARFGDAGPRNSTHGSDSSK
jgi:nucleoside diphosphate kinase